MKAAFAHFAIWTFRICGLIVDCVSAPLGGGSRGRPQRFSISMESTQCTPKSRRGRPRRGEGPDVPWPEVDRLLVHGEQVIDGKTGEERLTYPSLAVLAERYSVSRTLMWKYAHRHHCFERRKEAQVRTQARTDDKVIEKVSSARATHTVDVLGVVDQFLLSFEKDLRAGKVRTDSAADFDRLTRLREFVTGGADSRQELTGSVSLVAIQARHQRLRAQVERVPAELTGVVDDDDELAQAELRKEPAHGAAS